MAVCERPEEGQGVVGMANAHGVVGMASAEEVTGVLPTGLPVVARSVNPEPVAATGLYVAVGSRLVRLSSHNVTLMLLVPICTVSLRKLCS